MRKNKPAHLSTGKILIRVFRYALRSKFLLLAALLFLFVFSVLEIAQPLIIKRVIDDELAGVATVWTEVDTENEKTVRFDGKLYVKGALDGPRYTIRYYKDGYLLIDGEIPEKDNIVSIGAQAVIAKSDGGTYVADYRILTREEMRLFFEPSIKPITLMIILYAAVTIVILLARFLQRIAFTTSSLRLSLEMRKNMFQKMNRLPVAYFSTEPSGKIVTKMIYDTEGVRGLYEVMFSIVSSIVSLVMIYAGFFYLDWKLALFTLAAFPLIYLWMSVYRRIVNAYNHSIREMNSRINGKMAEFVNGAGIIQAFNKEKEMTAEYDGLLLENYATKLKHLRINTVFGYQLLNFIYRMVVVLVLVYFGMQYFSTAAIVTGTTIYVFVEYLGKLMSPIADIFSNLNSLEDSLVSASRVFEFLDKKEDTGIGAVTGVRFRGDIDFTDISFRYEEQYVLKNVSLSIKAGQFVGIVGATGSGKTTLMSLLERFYDLEEGKIFIDGVDYTGYSKQDVRNNIGIILQDPAIFEGTIKSNITLGVDVPDEVVIETLRKIGAGKFTSSYRDGIHTKVAYMGENLSTGEKQLIAFARILLRNPPIIILDEATANIDSETETLIQNALTVLSESRTTIVIAHRLSTIKNADMIYVMGAGRIVESGTHGELYQKEDGIYRSMYEALN
ncbi:MAG TPA: ABC transporter ATP-binding protein [Acholeplasmataceae bacterium]|jgi:ATP-binding cassette subfamily B multidrug efflux pump|nr:ABC transporter ATP-binding protein [Acholeplasmataceae bacterium]